MKYSRHKEGLYDVDKYDDGTTIYRLHGIIHNEHGPAIINERTGQELYYLEGIEFADKHDFDKYLRKQKLEKLLTTFHERSN